MTPIDFAGDLLSRLYGQDKLPYRLHFPGKQGALFENILVPQRLDITEAVCDGITAHVTCLATRADLPLNELKGVPVEIRIVTDTGDFKRICVLITEARQGQSDGGVTVVQFTGRDILAAMEGRRSNQAFKDQSALDIIREVLDGWRKDSPMLAHAFDYEFLDIDESRYPRRAATLQIHQGDSDFVRTLCARNGIAWFFRPGEDDAAAQQLVFFDDARQLPANAAGPIKYHRRSGTEERDAIGLLAPTYTLTSGTVTRSSFDHEASRVDMASETSAVDQGKSGNEFAAALRDARIQLPHAGDSWDDHQRLTRVDMSRHEGSAACLHGIGSARDEIVCAYRRIDGHPQLDTLAPADREYTTIRVQHWAENSLPKELDERAQTLLASSVDSAGIPGWAAASNLTTAQRRDSRGEHRYTNRFVAVRRDAPIIPAWNPDTDLPRMPHMTGIVAGPEGEAVYCDSLGRVQVRIHGLSSKGDGDGSDTAWVRVNFLWAGSGFGILFPLRVGMEVSLAFEQGDASRPMIVGSRYAQDTPPARFDHLGSLPANRALSGIVTREFNGARQQQLRFNDTRGQISAQLASDHAASQLNLGYLTSPMNDGRTEPRGEGIEARTQAALAARGERGLLITTAKGNEQLDRSELLGLAQVLQGIVEQLGEFAGTHHATGTDPTRFRQLVKHLQDWENGSNTNPDEGGGGAPIIAMGSTAGTGIVSQDNLVLGAQTNIDVVSAGHAQITAGQQIRQRAEAGVSVFAHTGGLESIAGKGLVSIQAHQGNIELIASDSIVLTAGVKVVIQAPEVHVISQGTQTQWSSGSIVEQASGTYVVKASSFAMTSGGDGIPAGVTLPSSELKFDQHIVLVDMNTDLPVTNQRCRILVEDGQTIDCVTDAQGKVPLFKSSVAYARYTVELLK